MKVQRLHKPDDFVPIQIILETEQEAHDLWHTLNCPYNKSLVDYCKERNIDGIDTFELFNALDKVYQP
jgi:phenylalanine-4-hydroxylase